MTRNSRTPKIKLIHKLKQAQKISIKSYRLLRSSIVLKNLNEPLVSLTHKLQLISASLMCKFQLLDPLLSLALKARPPLTNSNSSFGGLDLSFV